MFCTTKGFLPAFRWLFAIISAKDSPSPELLYEYTLQRLTSKIAVLDLQVNTEFILNAEQAACSVNSRQFSHVYNQIVYSM